MALGCRLHRARLPTMPDMTLTTEVFAGFGISVAFETTHVVLAVQGEVDLFTAPEFESVLHAIVGSRHLSVIIDLAECTFLDASGVGVIAGGAARLQQAGGTLRVRHASPMTHRVLGITGMADLEEDITPIFVPHLGPEQVLRSPVPINASRTQGRTRKLTALPSNADVVDGALRLVVALARATLAGADGASVSLRRHGRLSTVAASDQTVLDMDAGQYATGEGPCVDASDLGRWFHIESLATETRWPAFVPRAQELGIRAILSTPLLSHDEPVGALNIYSRQVGAFAPQDQEMAGLFAAETSSILTKAGAGATSGDLTRRLSEALGTRRVIAQAQGAIMQRDGVEADAAYTQLRRSSVATGRSMRDQALDIVTSTRGPRPLFDPAPRDHGTGDDLD
jgi:anti-anti-sigma factor